MINRTRLLKLFTLTLMIILASACVTPVLAQDPVEEPKTFQPFLDETGTYFELENGVTITSSSTVHVVSSASTEMTEYHIESADGSISTTLTLSNLEPFTTYYMYEDDYNNENAFKADDTGSYTYMQDLSQQHYVFIQMEPSTIFIDDVSGWSEPVGTWDPLTKTATLTQDVSETIQINSDDIILDLNGHSITGSGNGYGIYLNGRTGVTIKNGEVENFDRGIYLSYSSSNTISDNVVTNNNFAGIRIGDSNYNTISNNVVTNNNEGIFLISSVISSDSNTISNNVVTNNKYHGIWLELSCSSNTISNNVFTNNDYGIYLYASNYNTISNNVVTNNKYHGIWLEITSSSNTISNNVVTNNNEGIYLDGSSSNTISNNVVTNNDYGIYLFYSYSNKIYHNNIIENVIQAYESGGTGNSWDDDYPSGGNYWSDYTGVDSDSDGIGDTPYVFDYNQDIYPLMEPWISEPVEYIEGMTKIIESWELPQGVESSLIHQLDTAANLLSMEQEAAAVNVLSRAFINTVEHQRGKKLTEEQADCLMSLVETLLLSITNE